ncbi:MAG: PEPxxWA-CTERM sorting domain-containing protein [Sandaracinobacteroides sp.]
MTSFFPVAFATLAFAATAFEAPSNAVVDPAGDFLATHAGAPAADIDILRADVVDFDIAIAFTADMAGLVGTTAGTSYVWGIDRGAGTDGLFTGVPPVGPGVTFDAVVVIGGDGSGSVIAFNDGAPPTITGLGFVLIAGNTVSTLVDTALLPSRGFALGDYRFNLWTRSGGGNAGIADLGQETGTFGYSPLAGAVPEPASWALLITGFGLVGAAMRRRRPAMVHA